MPDETPPKQTVDGLALIRSLSEIVADFADLFQKELKLAKAEVSDNIARTLRAGVWMIVAGVFAVLILLLIVQAAVFGLIEWGVAPPWACLLVALALGVMAIGCFLKGRSDVARGIVPERAISQIKQDIKSTKEQLV